MATVAMPNVSALPMYDPEYLRAVTGAKQSHGVYPTNLDEEAADLRRDFSENPAFESMHFVPAYFPNATPEQMLDALLRVADGGDAGGESAEVAFGIDAVRRIFRSRDERKTLRKFVELLSAEWSTFHASFWNDRHTATMESVAQAQAVVDDLVRSPLAASLARWREQSGAVFLSTPVGAEGRIFLGDPMNPADNVVIVRLPENSPTGALTAALSLPRELCFPQITTAVQALRIGQFDPYQAEQASGRGAVLCGARLIDRHLPRYSQVYRDAFMETAPGMTAQEFAAAYTVDPRLDTRITELVAGR
jgi:hypothetical protein